MSRMGMLKTISGRFGYVVGEDPATDNDDGARQPDTPNTHTKRDKKEKRSRGGGKKKSKTSESSSSSSSSNSNKGASVAPSIFNRPERQGLKQGHDPNKVHGVGLSTRQIIVEPSQRHFNYQPSTRNLIVEPSIRNLGLGLGPSTRNLSNKSSSSSSSDQRGMRVLDKKSSMRNMNTNPSNDNHNKNKTINNNTQRMNGSSPEKKVNNARTMISIDENSGFGKVNSITETSNTSFGTMNSIDEKKTVIGNMSSIAEKSSRSMSSVDEKKTVIVGNMSSIVEKSNRSMNSIDEKKKVIGNMSSIAEKGTRSMNSIVEEKSSSSNTSTPFRGMSSIDGKGPGVMSSIDENHSPLNNTNGSSNSKSSTSTKSTATNSTSTKSSLDSIIDASNNNSNNTTSNHNKSSSNHSSDTVSNNKSNHSEMTRNADNRSASVKSRERKAPIRGRPGKRSGGSFGTPAHFDRDRPSTALITRKELEEILAAKVKEEMMEKKTMPPKSGTNSTDLWVANANKDPISEEFSVASGHSLEDESPFGRGNPEYDINFHDISEEEMTEHTEHTVHTDDSDQDGTGDSFDVGDLTLADSMDRRCTTIRFDEYDELQTCLHINDYTQGEIKRSWYKREDYDKMVDLARKTASKAVKREKELRDELDLVVSQSPPRAGRRNGENTGNYSSGDNRSVGSGKTADGKRKKPIEYRGLEAWTPEGSKNCRSLKEDAIELVWNEQSRQWEDGSFDPDAISEVYRPVAKIALVAAHDRALADEKMVKKLSDQEETRAEKKRNRNILHKSKAVIKRTATKTGKGLVQGAGKVLTETSKGAVKIGKRGMKAGVATATLDPRMMKEALKVRVHGKKKRECKHEMELATSKAAHERDVEELEGSGSISLQDSTGLLLSSTNMRPGLQRPGLSRPGLATAYEINDGASDKLSEDNSALRDYSVRSSEAESNLSTATSNKKKKSKLKLLGVVPIPGTQKKYSEDRRADRADKRLAKMDRRPSWEASTTVGKH